MSIESKSVKPSSMMNIKTPARLAILAGGLTFFVVLFSPNQYRSEARLLPIESKPAGGLGGLASAAAAFGVTLPGGEGSDANFTDILGSRWLREQVLQSEFTYHARRWRFGTEHLETKRLFTVLGANTPDQGLKALDGVITATRDSKSKIISITAETISPELSQQIVQQMCKLLEKFLLEKGRTRGSAKAAYAEERLIEARKEMDYAEGILIDFIKINKNYLTSGEPLVKLKANRLESEFRLRQQLVSAISMNREQALLEEKNDIPILNILDRASLPISKSKPARSEVIVFFTFIVGVSSWIWFNRNWIREQLSSAEN